MKILQFILDTILPPDPQVRAIENMSPEEFIISAQKLGSKDVQEGIISFFSYKDECIKTALIELKSYRNRKIADLLGSVLGEMIRKNVLPTLGTNPASLPLLIPIPMTKKRLRERGWNQCNLLVQGATRIDNEKNFEVSTDILVKVRENEDQVGKGRAERFLNLKDCFEVTDEKQIQGRTVIVIDDIVTTGATLNEAKRALKKAGAENIILVSMAH